jgi:DNA-binding MarR family transcriptional regulator
MTIKTKSQSDLLAHLVSIYVARRELVRVLKRDLLRGEREIKLEEAEILLGLFRAQTGEYPVIALDEKGFTGLRQIEAAQMLSQSQIHRRVTGLITGKYLEEKLPRRHTSAIKVRLTTKGEGVAEQYWKDYRTFASLVLQGVDASQRLAHLRVNDAIQRKIHGLSLPSSSPSEKVEPVENLLSIFAAAKAIRKAIELEVVLPEGGLSVERADVLVFLYIRGGEFTSFGEIQRNIVQSFSPSRHLISKWIAEMATDKTGLVERQPLSGNRMAAAITQEGRDVVKPILERYKNLEENLTADISKEDLRSHLRINRRISDAIQPRLKQLISAAE